MKKKSYNPFTMWFAIGLPLLGLFWSIWILIMAMTCGGGECGMVAILALPLGILFAPFHEYFTFDNQYIGLSILIFLQTLILFLVGWGIHSLVRRLK